MNDPKELCFSVNGYRIAAVEYGDPNGLPVLALHGWLDNAASFTAIGRSLSGVRLIALDLIGHGLSDHRPQQMPYHIWDNVVELRGVIQELGLTRVNLLGHSMGASIAMLYAGAFPDEVDRLALIEGLAPLTYASDELPELFAGAIKKRQKMLSKKAKQYPNFESMVQARMNGRWPLERENAECLLARGVDVEEGEVNWRHDPKLLLPSLVRFDEAQVKAFIHAVQAETLLITDSEGGASLLFDTWCNDLKLVSRYHFPGGHHLHMNEPVAGDIAELVNQWVI